MPCTACQHLVTSVEPTQANRSRRLGLVLMRTRPIRAATDSTPTNSRVGAPASHSRPNRMAVRMIAVPMSPPSMISPSSMKATGTSGTSMCFHCVSSRFSCLRAIRSAAQSTSASLPISLGWIWKEPPSEIQFWLPLTDIPIPGTCTSAIRNTAPARIG
ncbi:hypothetical protein CF54_24505 [Streptomyces sp. Tu 6176]|nr:hypothetical protein CF54_24505 [Streptomyces sp. Tu 6176]